MATIKYEVIASQRRLDGTWNVKIRVTHNNKVRRVSTPFYVTKEQMTKGYKIKDNKILAVLDETLRVYRERINAVGIAQKGMDIDVLMKFVTEEKRVEGVRFYEWADAFVNSKKSPGVYRNALNSYMSYVGVKSIFFHDITRTSLQGWVDSLKPETARNLLPRFKHIFNSGKEHFNDEDEGQILIPGNPFTKLALPEVKSEPRKKAVGAEVIRLIAMIPDNSHARSLRNMTRDMYLLSFSCIGLNAADIYDMRCKSKDVLDYERKKTRVVRKDRAFISVDVPRLAEPIIEQYADVTGERRFRMHTRYSSALVFDNALTHGMEQVQAEVLRLYRLMHPADKRRDREVMKELNIDGIRFYSARHSWATIARNDCGVDKWTVHEALNHVDSVTRIDDVYIRKDFRLINEANRKVLEFVFGYFDEIMDGMLGYLDRVMYICTIFHWF